MAETNKMTLKQYINYKTKVFKELKIPLTRREEEIVSGKVTFIAIDNYCRSLMSKKWNSQNQ